MVNVDQLKVHLATLDDRMYQWSQADDEVFQRLNLKGAPLGDVVEAVVDDRRARIEAGLPDPRAELFALLDTVADDYLTADAETRGAIRGAFNGKDRVLYGVSNYIAQAAERLQGANEGVWLRRGLAAASILDGRLDEQDTLIHLGRLYRQAAEAGLDPRTEFEAVAALSSADYAGQHGSTRSVLEGFPNSDDLRQSVGPEV